MSMLNRYAIRKDRDIVMVQILLSGGLGTVLCPKDVSEAKPLEVIIISSLAALSDRNIIEESRLLALTLNAYGLKIEYFESRALHRVACRKFEYYSPA
jgi:hypothetical protein